MIMRISFRSLFLSSVIIAVGFYSASSLQADDKSTRPDSEATIDQLENELVIHVGASEIARYVFRDARIPRPYFAHVRTPGGIQVTRTHPPVAGQNATDHSTMHPGIWMAFGDLNGEDFWRNKATIEHIKFTQNPRSDRDSASFVEEKRYLAADGKEVCRERFGWTLHVIDSGFLMEWDSTFTSDRDFYFGDQEEMGLGVRIATPITEQNGGQLRDSEGRRKAHQIWSHAARWCDYSGAIGEHLVGITILCHPENFRESWMHARNYGFVAANPFGRKAMKKGDASKVVVRPDTPLRLRYGIWIHQSPSAKSHDCESAFQRYLRLAD